MGGGAVLTIKQIDGSDLKERRVGFFKKSYYSFKKIIDILETSSTLKLFIY